MTTTAASGSATLNNAGFGQPPLVPTGERIIVFTG
jgi:hypothetical protein